MIPDMFNDRLQWQNGSLMLIAKNFDFASQIKQRVEIAIKTVLNGEFFIGRKEPR